MSIENLPSSTVIACLPLVFRHLDFRDVVFNCSRVCPIWNLATSLYIGWLKTESLVILYNPRCLQDVINLRNITTLDLLTLNFLREDQVAHNNEYLAPESFWQGFKLSVGQLISLQFVIFSNCPAHVLENLPFTNLGLVKLHALNVRGSSVNLTHFKRFRRLSDLYIAVYSGIEDFDLNVGNSSYLERLNLRILTLTGFKELPFLKIPTITNLSLINYLRLGHCTNFPNDFIVILLVNLKNLKILRLEKYRGKTVSTTSIFEMIANIPTVRHFEIIDFDVPDDIEEGIGKCANLSTLLIVPRACDVAPRQNRNILCGIVHLRQSLERITWAFPVRRWSDVYNYTLSFHRDIPVIDQFNESDVEDITDPPEYEIFNLQKLCKYLKEFFPNSSIIVKNILFSYRFSTTPTS